MFTSTKVICCLLAAISVSLGTAATSASEVLPVNAEQRVEIAGTIGQSPVGWNQAIRYWGAPAHRNPLPEHTIPQHPYLSPQGFNGMHNDSYSSDVSNCPGPLGINPLILTHAEGSIGGECATMVYDPRGFLYTVSAGFAAMHLIAFDPVTLEPLIRYPLPQRETTQFPLDIDEIMNDTSGGAYFHVDQDYRPIVAAADRHIRFYRLNVLDQSAPDEIKPGYEWVVEEDFDLNDHLEQYRFTDRQGDSRLPRVTDAIPDWNGAIWFTCREGVIGFIDMDSKDVRSIKLDNDEEIQNSLSVARDGVYVLSDFALYRFERDRFTGALVYSWCIPYERGTVLKPGSLTLGSGTTPTLIGHDLIAIADNADEHPNLLVYRRRKHFSGDRLVCKVPLFQPYEGVAENSFIGYRNSLIIMNNYGYNGPVGSDYTAPGITRIDVREDRSGCDVVWTSDEKMQTTLPKLSTDTGLIYFYTREPVPGHPGAMAWYFVMIDFETGRTINKIFAGTGYRMNSNWGQIYLMPDGRACMGVLNGIISLSDRAQEGD
nr:hypothetical protein [Deltaproteobacteria bacterium]